MFFAKKLNFLSAGNVIAAAKTVVCGYIFTII